MDYTQPVYTIKYLAEEGGWKLSPFKMTIAYAVKQYAGLEWDHLPETEEYYEPSGMPVSGANSMAHLLRGFKG